MMVGVGPHFHGFMLNRIWEEAVLCHKSHYKTKYLNSHRAGHAYSKHQFKG